MPATGMKDIPVIKQKMYKIHEHLIEYRKGAAVMISGGPFLIRKKERDGAVGIALEY